jgi:hypothetical protein
MSVQAVHAIGFWLDGFSSMFIGLRPTVQPVHPLFFLSEKERRDGRETASGTHAPEKIADQHGRMGSVDKLCALSELRPSNQNPEDGQVGRKVLATNKRPRSLDFRHRAGL